ncbi:MAG: DNA gyrase subunit B [Phycisphaerales bacterium]
MPNTPPPTASSTPPVEVPPSSYGADQIQVLEGLEAVRKRPGMYIGGTGIGPLHHLIYEVVDNSIDEAMAGFATSVWVTIGADGSCTVLDNGRGIPVESKKHENPAYDGKPAIEIAMTVLHAGGKFGQEGSAYKVSGGLHGVGVSCVNALSEWLEAEVFRAGKIHQIGFERGKTTMPLHVIGTIPADAPIQSGTKVSFMPDPQIFEDTTFDYPTMQNRLRELSYLNPGVAIHLTDERVGADGKPRHEVFKAKDGLTEYVEFLMTGKQPVSDRVHVRKQEADFFCEVAMQYHDGYNETLLAFTNNIFNKDGGTHAQGFKVALTRAMNGYAKKSGILKENDPVPSGEDLREGLVAVVSVKLPNPTFNNQPKERLLNPEIEKFVADVVGEQLQAWLAEHPAEAKRLCLKGIVAAQAREAARKARELTRRKSALDSGSMPHKLRDCKTKDVDRSEMFIVEGDSAGGSATQGRNVDTQAILPLRGKLLNVEKARIDKVLSFEEIRTLISALRCGIGEEFDIAKLRYGRVVIMTDADVDGSHIRTLLLTFFFRQMPELIRRGKIFCAQPPLYMLEWGGGKNKRAQYVVNQAQMDAVLTEQGLSRSSLIVRDITKLDPMTGQAAVSRRIGGDDLRRVVRTLTRLEELVEIAERRGVKFADLLEARDNDPTGNHRLPSHRLTWTGGEAWAWSEEQARKIAASQKLTLADMPIEPDATPDTTAAEGASPAAPIAAPAAPATPASNGTHAVVAPVRGPTCVLRELHENRELERLFEQLGRLGLDINDYTLTQEQASSGDTLPSKFAWEMEPTKTAKDQALEEKSQEIAEEEPVETRAGEATPPAKKAEGKFENATNLGEILYALHEVGRRGLDIKRFKGLGEMDAEQLWETTMDPSKRTLLRVNWDIAGQADQLFSILMGEEVEPRRKFIEEHALEVKNLDV